MMTSQRPLILISNDDGIAAKGIQELTKMLRDMADIIVMAPDSPRSGSAAAITSQNAVTYECVHKEEGYTAYQCTGTPADCIKLALETVTPRTPDLVIGGINHGDNSAVNVHYSGTMGVVIEGCMKGIPSIGFSVCDHDPNTDFSYTEPYIIRIVRETLKNNLPEGTCLNVNFPQKPPYKSIKICRQTKGRWEKEWCNCTNPRNGQKLYWLTGHFENHEPENEDNDKWALDHGYVAITPTKIDMTAYELMKEMQEKWQLSQ